MGKLCTFDFWPNIPFNKECNCSGSLMSLPPWRRVDDEGSVNCGREAELISNPFFSMSPVISPSHTAHQGLIKAHSHPPLMTPSLIHTGTPACRLFTQGPHAPLQSCIQPAALISVDVSEAHRYVVPEAPSVPLSLRAPSKALMT